MKNDKKSTSEFEEEKNIKRKCVLVFVWGSKSSKDFKTYANFLQLIYFSFKIFVDLNFFIY